MAERLNGLTGFLLNGSLLNVKSRLMKSLSENFLNGFRLTKTALAKIGLTASLNKSRVNRFGLTKTALSVKREEGGGVAEASRFAPRPYARLNCIEAAAIPAYPGLFGDILAISCSRASILWGLFRAMSPGPLMIDPLPAIFSTTPTPQKRARGVYITPHRPHAIFHNRKNLNQNLNKEMRK